MTRLVAAATAGLAALFAVLAVAVSDGGRALVLGDEVLGTTVHRWALAHPWAVDLAWAFTWLGSGYVLVPLVTVVAAALWWRAPRGRLLAGYLLVTTIGGQLLSTATKRLLERDRPAYVDPLAQAYGFSFPSGHAMAGVYTWGAFAVLAWLVVVPVRRRLGLTLAVGCAVVAPLVGASRVVLGVHWPLDVLAGWLLAVAWLLLTTAVLVSRLAVTDRPSGRTPSGRPAPQLAPPG